MDFQDFLSTINSSGITDRSPENPHPTHHNIKRLLKFDIQDDFCDICGALASSGYFIRSSIKRTS